MLVFSFPSLQLQDEHIHTSSWMIIKYHRGHYTDTLQVLLVEHTPGIPTHGSGGCPYSQTFSLVTNSKGVSPDRAFGTQL